MKHNNYACVCVQNYVRVVEVWWDEYKDYFYASRPETLTLAYGDTSELKRFRYIMHSSYLFLYISLISEFLSLLPVNHLKAPLHSGLFFYWLKKTNCKQREQSLVVNVSLNI